MASEAPAKPRGLSLYANLLGKPAENTSPSENTTADTAVLGSDLQDNAAVKQQPSAAPFRFQPTKRPQVGSQKARPGQQKPAASLPVKPQNQGNQTIQASSNPTTVKSTLADWAGGDDDDVNGYYEEKRQRGGRKKRKKNRENAYSTQNWDDIYDPSRPNNYDEYKHSEEKFRELREWKDRLYAHRMRRSSSGFSDSEGEAPQVAGRFAPPSSFHQSQPPPAPPPPRSPSPPPAPPTAQVPDDASGEDAYARRLRMSQGFQGYQSTTTSRPMQSATSTNPSATISRAPVRYNLPPAPAELPRSEAELQQALEQEQRDEENDGDENENAERSSRPGQKGFAERLMSKYGWTKGTGLGAKESGILDPLRFKVEKQKKKPDSEGGGFATPAGRGKIIGGRKKGGEEEGKFGTMSEVVVLQGMLKGMDLQTEFSEGNLMQEIGDECNEKYGRVERVYVDQSISENAPVFVKFTSQLSALRAVNALEGRIFNGNAINARFYDTEKFDKGVYS